MKPEEAKAKYQELVRSRQKTVTRGYKCLCCRDTGLIPFDVVRRYHLAEGIIGEYESIIRGEPGILCRASNCEGNETLISKPSQNGGSEEKLAPKFAEWAVRQDINPQTCDWIHHQEWKRWTELAQQLQPEHPKLLDAITAIAKPLS